LFREQPAGLSFDENFAGNPAHFVLVMFGLLSVWPLRRRLGGTVRGYACALIIGFVLFAAILRWQPWHTRLELPYLVLGAPLVGLAVERLGVRIAQSVSVVLLVAMIPWVVYNQARPLVGARSILTTSRSDQYFTNRPSLREPYLAAIRFIADQGCAQIGFISTQDGWEYPLWALAPTPIHIESVAVGNMSAAFIPASQKTFQPCAIFSLEPSLNDMASLAIDSRVFTAAYRSEPVVVFTPSAVD
jgi:hypothetical protein